VGLLVGSSKGDEDEAIIGDKVGRATGSGVCGILVGKEVGLLFTGTFDGFRVLGAELYAGDFE